MRLFFRSYSKSITLWNPDARRIQYLNSFSITDVVSGYSMFQYLSQTNYYKKTIHKYTTIWSYHIQKTWTEFTTNFHKCKTRESTLKMVTMNKKLDRLCVQWFKDDKLSFLKAPASILTNVQTLTTSAVSIELSSVHKSHTLKVSWSQYFRNEEKCKFKFKPNRGKDLSLWIQ